jgi:hypothetical protein
VYKAELVKEAEAVSQEYSQKAFALMKERLHDCITLGVDKAKHIELRMGGLSPQGVPEVVTNRFPSLNTSRSLGFCWPSHTQNHQHPSSMGCLNYWGPCPLVSLDELLK